jgi:hypothetical protein
MEVKVNRDMHGLTFHKNQPIKHLMLLRKLYPEIKGRPYLLPFMEYFQTLPYKNIPLIVKFGSPLAWEEIINLIFPSA